LTALSAAQQKTQYHAIAYNEKPHLYLR